ncbi:MAG: beta-ketoacyl synthase N-terminal-like domain-containing protein [Gammaproteobacteria bacterium]
MSAPENVTATDVSGEALSPVKRALIEVRELRKRVAMYEAERSEPVAIVGMGCRLPGGIVDADGLWKLLSRGEHAVSDVPASRWDVNSLFDANPDAAGKMYTRSGAFMHDVDRFDPYFFGIPPREAASMDPQQRLLLEVAWETLENAGLDPTRLAETASGVFLGIGSNDYALLQTRASSLEDIDAYLASGSAHSVAAGRLSYFLGFQGPCIAIDTACSSSLVAIHQACMSLRQRECRLALAGGSNLILVPDLSVNFCRARMLSPGDKCRTFDAAADGYVRGEGVVLIALKRLADAQADGDRILAVIRGSAVNQDGRSTGLTVPNGPAQTAVIQRAVANAGLDALDVRYVEAHGTGTPLGDPIEVQALAAALGESRSAGEPLLIGSIKTNLGHLEATAGVAGLMKVVLSMQHGALPAHLHSSTPNPHIDWARLPVAVTTTQRPWPAGRKIAGVSSFGFSGTNAHVILEEAPVAPSDATLAPARPLSVLPLSARDDRALKALAALYEEYLSSNPGVSFAAVCDTASAGRAHFNHRLSILASDTVEARAELARFARGESSQRLQTGHVTSKPQIGFSFTGGQSPEQAEAYAAEVAVAALWKSWGVEPEVILGGGTGEYAATGAEAELVIEMTPHGLVEKVAELYVRGVRLNWLQFCAPYRSQKLALPTYPFQRQRYWFNDTRSTPPQVESPWERALSAGRRHAEFAPVDLNLDSFPAKWAALEKLSVAYMLSTLRDFGLFARAGETRSAADVVAHAALQPVYVKLMARWLARLVSSGVLESLAGGYVAVAPLPEPALDAARSEAREAFRDYPAMFDYVDLCGSRLADVLTGRESALETLFPSGSSHIADGLYQTSVVARYFNEVVRAVVQAVAIGAQSLSVLEIGAGTGGTTALLLPSLSAGRTRYVFTDLGKSFLVQASRKFAAYPFVDYALLDIERPPASQGFAERAFNVVVAANVLHATGDLSATLRHAGALLKSGGVLVMLETTEHPVWLDISTGLIEGWQKFADPLRDSHPLLDSAQWSALLAECGFDAVDAFPAADAPTALLGQRVIIARVPHTATAGSPSTSRLVDAQSSINARADVGEEAPLRATLDAAAPGVRKEMLVSLVSAEVAAVLGLDSAHQPGPEQRLMDFGVDSLMAVDLRNRLAKRIALTRKLTATLIFDYPTVSAIAGHLADEMLGQAPSPRAEATPIRRIEPSVAASAIEQMDEDAAEALLLEKLQSL